MDPAAANSLVWAAKNQLRKRTDVAEIPAPRNSRSRTQAQRPVILEDFSVSPIAVRVQKSLPDENVRSGRRVFTFSGECKPQLQGTKLIPIKISKVTN